MNRTPPDVRCEATHCQVAGCQQGTSTHVIPGRTAPHMACSTPAQTSPMSGQTPPAHASLSGPPGKGVVWGDGIRWFLSKAENGQIDLQDDLQNTAFEKNEGLTPLPKNPEKPQNIIFCPFFKHYILKQKLGTLRRIFFWLNPAKGGSCKEKHVPAALP